MARCIAFDKSTAQDISRNLHLLTICDSEGDPVQSALHSSYPTTLLALPAASGERVLVATFRRSQTPPLASSEPIGSETNGFLGLSDQQVYPPEPEAAKKWWQKILS